MDSEFVVMFCADPGVWGVLGEDLSAPIDGTSLNHNSTQGGCEAVAPLAGMDMIITSCVSPCGPTPTIDSTWGTLKANYR